MRRGGWVWRRTHWRTPRSNGDLILIMGCNARLHCFGIQDLLWDFLAMYQASTDVGPNTSHTFSNLQHNTEYCFVVTAFTPAGRVHFQMK
jgi:hypothetical protein